MQKAMQKRRKIVQEVEAHGNNDEAVRHVQSLADTYCRGSLDSLYKYLSARDNKLSASVPQPQPQQSGGDGGAAANAPAE
jgi:hypothetical protein